MGIPYLNMSDDELFPLTNLALPAWILLALLPRWSYTFPITTTVSLFFSALYIALMLDVLVFHPIDAGIDDFTSLDGLLKLFSFKSAIFGGWVHYIAFDLWTGMWDNYKEACIKLALFFQHSIFLLLLPRQRTIIFLFWFSILVSFYNSYSDCQF